MHEELQGEKPSFMLMPALGPLKKTLETTRDLSATHDSGPNHRPAKLASEMALSSVSPKLGKSPCELWSKLLVSPFNNPYNTPIYYIIVSYITPIEEFRLKLMY